MERKQSIKIFMNKISEFSVVIELNIIFLEFKLFLEFKHLKCKYST